MAATYSDFVNRAQQAGLLREFSDEDLRTAQMYPEFGLSILQSKQDWHNATTEEARKIANNNANATRNAYKGMTAPSSFSYDAPKPTYSYDVNNDESYAAYRKQYLREADRATQNTVASAAAATGGIPSSYAMTAAQQAGDYYRTKLTDKVPELEAKAYSRYRNELNDWYTDRSNAYQQYLNEKSDAQAAADAQREQTLYQEQLARADASTARSEAQSRVQNAIAAGVMPSDADIEAGGYDRDTVSRMVGAYAAESGKTDAQYQVKSAIGAGVMPSESLIAAAGYDRQTVQALVQASRAASYSGGSSSGASGTSKTGAQYQVKSAVSAGIMPSESLIAAAGYDRQMIQALVKANSEENGTDGLYTVVNGYGDLSETAKQLYEGVKQSNEKGTEKALGAAARKIAMYRDKGWITEQEEDWLAEQLGV